MITLEPIKIIKTEGETSNGVSLLKKKVLQVGLFDTDLFVMKGKSSIILDFGKEVSGGVRILTYSTNGKADVRLRFGESVGETCAEIGEKNATNNHATRDMVVELQLLSDMPFGQTGFRFLRLDSLNDDIEIKIKAIVANVDTDQREQVGSFWCNDELVNTIWSTACYTLRLCLQNGMFWDGIKRDRLVWIGDLYPETRAARCLFNNVPEVVNSLDFAMNETPLPKWMNGIPAYSLWWLIILADEFKYSSNKALFDKYIPYVKGLIEQISLCIKEDGATAYGDNFIDWPSYYQEGESKEKYEDGFSGMNYLTKIAVEKIRCFLIANDESAFVCDSILSRLEKDKRHVNAYKQMAGLGVWSGDKSENNKEVLLRGGAKGMSTFMSYPILIGVAKCGEAETALSMMKEYYGGMLSVGATSFWEDFDIAWLENCGRIDELPVEGKKDIHGDYGAFWYVGYRHSLCHGWSAGVIPYLMELVAGITFEDTEMRKIRISPSMSGLTHIKAAYPTPYGLVQVEHKLNDNGEMESQVSVPKEIEIIHN